jgi:hypothetical protein
MGLALVVPLLLGQKNADVDGMARERVSLGGMGFRWKNTDASPWGCSNFRRLVVCPEGDGLEVLDEPPLPFRLSTVRASQLVIRLPYGFEPNSCIDRPQSIARFKS